MDSTLNHDSYHLRFVVIWQLLKLTCLVTLFDRKLQVIKNSQKLTFFLAFLINFCPFKT
mgnify:CR=1 FL=1